MHSKIVTTALAIATAVLFTGCATSLPMTTSMDNSVVSEVSINSRDTVTYSYLSDVEDGEIQPYTAGKTNEVSGHPGYIHTQSSTLDRMMKAYVSTKFTDVTENSDTQISVTLQDFWLEQYSTDSAGAQALAAFAGGETNTNVNANIHAVLTVRYNGEEVVRPLRIQTEDTYVAGYSTGTETSSLYRGQNSLEHTHARNINQANNRLLLLVNSYLEDLGL